MIKWLIQDSGITDSFRYSNFGALQEIGYDYAGFGIIPFTSQVTNLENILVPNTKFIMRGGTRIMTILNGITHLSECSPSLSQEQYDLSEQYIAALKAGIFYDVEKFDQKYYSKFDLPLVNRDAEYYKVSENMDKCFDVDMFMKPSRDLKAFNGGILEAGTTIGDFILNSYHQDFYVDEYAVIAPARNIKCEYRLFAVGGKIVAGSMYKLGTKVLANRFVPQEVIDAAQDYIKIYSPHDIFTIDLAETSTGYEIVEYNCWNASGLYDSDVKALYGAVHDYVSKG